MVPLATIPIPVQNEEKNHIKVPNTDELVTPKSKKTNNPNLNSIYKLIFKNFDIFTNKLFIKI